MAETIKEVLSGWIGKDGRPAEVVWIDGSAATTSRR